MQYRLTWPRRGRPPSRTMRDDPFKRAIAHAFAGMVTNAESPVTWACNKPVRELIGYCRNKRIKVEVRSHARAPWVELAL